ncbi:MAG: S41 family peptidase [Anaerolineae bacterium]|nr:S41 family peptidase [Anaerolineae bacterium]
MNGGRGLIKFVLACATLVILLGFAFFLGFGSACLLVASGALPVGAERPAVPVPSPTPGEESLFPTLIPTVAPVPAPTGEDEETFQLFWEVWALVQENFYGELPDMRTVTYAAIRGMLSTLGDEYTAFIEPEAAAILAEDATGKFEGIGAYVKMSEEGILEISELFEGGPAERAGVRKGDRVLAVDGVSIIGVSLYEAIGRIRGPAGTPVTLLIEREGVEKPFEVTVVRESLEIPIVDAEMRDDGIGVIRLYEFSATAGELVSRNVEELLDRGARGIVFDLRSNPGGWLEQAIKVSDIFLDDGVILFERWSDGREQVFEARPGDVGEEVPLVVLVNGGSASAAEIVAGALQDHERAVLIGEHTFGKGSVQRPFTLRDGSELRVTVAHWFTPDNRAIHNTGLTPDIEVPWPEEGVVEGVDPQLDRAVGYLLTGK